jgi:capsular polysaccharide biosynthesis protein
VEKKPRRFADRTLRRSIVAGAAVALLLLVAGLVLAASSKAQWTAESVSVVLPDAQLSEADSAAYYETLSRGQIVATFAEVASNERFTQQAEQNLGLDAARSAAVTSEVTVAPSTSVLLIRVTSDDRTVAEQVTQEMTNVSQAYLQGLARPYRLDVVNPGTGTAFRSSTSPLVIAGAAVVVALVGGLAIQQAVYHSLVALRPGRRRALASAPAGPDPAGAPPSPHPAGPETQPAGATLDAPPAPIDRRPQWS